MSNLTWNTIRELKSSAEDVFEGHLEKTTLNNDEFGEYSEDEFIVNSSISLNSARIGFFALFIFVSYIIVKFISKQDYVPVSTFLISTEIVMIVLFLISCIIPTYYIIRNAQLIKIDYKGIEVLSDFIPWSEINETYIESRHTMDLTNYILLIKTKNRNYRKVISQHKENGEYISHIVETFRLRYGIPNDSFELKD